MRTPTAAGLGEPANADNPARNQQEPASFNASPSSGTGAMAPLALHEKSRYRAAASYARRLYPGPLGELVYRELTAYAEFGYRMGCDALIPRLAAEVLAAPAFPPAGPVDWAALVHEASRAEPTTSSRSNWPPLRFRRGHTT